jgi:hypothetical protein
MKTQLMALAAALASTPALASLGTSDATKQGIALEPAAFASPASMPADRNCGQPQNMMLILHDERGDIVAAAVVQVTPDC